MAFEAILAQQLPGGVARSKWRHFTLTFSVLLHAAALAFGLAHSIWQVAEMSLPPVEVTLAVAAPPPAPAPLQQRSSAKRQSRSASVKPKALVAPHDKPKEEAQPPIEQPSEQDQGEEKGAEQGIAGGLPGGIPGGVAPLPPEKSAGPQLLSMRAGNELLIINPNQRPYRLNLPEELSDRMGTGETIGPILQICVTAQGTVQNVRIVKPSIPLIDTQIPVVIPRWRYRPLLISGQAQPFCYVTKYSLRAN
jgi:protein TonB